MTVSERDFRTFDPTYLDTVCRAVGEKPSGSYPSPPGGVGEKLVRCMWFDQFLDPEQLVTEDGRPIQVLSPGYWNEGAGPDFLNAELRFAGGPVVRGAVEIHTLASDWKRHGHGADPAYDEVILHVVFTNDLGSPWLDSAGRRVAQLALERGVSGDLREVIEALDIDLPRADAPGSAGPCREAAARGGRSPEWLGQFLDMAGDARLLLKAERFARDMERGTPDQCLWEGFLDALGYKGNRRPFRQLAELAPVAELRSLAPPGAPPDEAGPLYEAALFGVAGLLPGEGQAADWDGETRAYVARLHAEWAKASGAFGGRRMEAGAWRFGATRPVNYPTRRIGAAAAFLAGRRGGGLYRGVAEALARAGAAAKPAAKARMARNLLEGLLLGEGDGAAPGGYWRRRCTFGGAPMPRSTRLLGRERAGAVVVNVVAPLVLARARAEGETAAETLLHGLYASLPRAPENSVTRFMGTRLFGGSDAAAEVVRSVRRQQGMMQIYRDFCERTDTTCEHCALAAVLAGRA